MKLIDANIRAMFAGAGDFIARTLRCGEHTLYAYAIDGLISGGDMSDYVIKPIAQTLQGEDMQSLFTIIRKQIDKDCSTKLIPAL